MSMSEDVVLVEPIDSVGWVTLNRPERRNALNEALVRRLESVLSDLEVANWCRAVVLTGAGKAFCAGGDLDDNIDVEPDAARAGARHRAFLAAAQRLRAFPKPTIAAVHGSAVGAGASLALMCDEVIMESDARLGLIFLQVGLPPDLLCAETLQRRVGWTVATELLHSGRMVSGRQAKDIGLIHRAVDDSVADVALERAQELAMISPYAFAATKALLRLAGAAGPGLVELEEQVVGAAVATPEFQQATAHFRSSRG